MTDEERKEKEKFDRDMERFKVVLETRNFEIALFWKRCNYFLALNTALAAGILASFIKGGMPPWFILGGCAAGVFVCFAWIQVGLGAKYWQSHWEQIVIDEQESVGFCESEERGYFGIDGTDERVKKNLFPPGKKFGYLDACYKAQVLMKPSVSRWMHKTAVFFFLAWGAGGLWVLWRMFG